MLRLAALSFGYRAALAATFVATAGGAIALAVGLPNRGGDSPFPAATRATGATAALTASPQPSSSPSPVAAGVPGATPVALAPDIAFPEGLALIVGTAGLGHGGGGFFSTGAVVLEVPLPAGVRTTGNLVHSIPAPGRPLDPVYAWDAFDERGSAPLVVLFRPGTPAARRIARLPVESATVASWLDGTRLLLTAGHPGECTPAAGTTATAAGLVPLLLDVPSNSAAFASGPFRDCDSAGGNIVLAARTGVDARVNAPGDGLNLREAPLETSPVRECMADGTLIGVVGKDGVPEGWLPASDPSGASGWASAEYISR